MSNQRLLLKMRNDFGKLIWFDPFDIRYVLVTEGISQSSSCDINGLASTKEDGFCACYKNQGILWIAFNSRAYPVTSALTSRWSMEDWKPSAEKK